MKMNDRIVINPNFKNNGELHNSLAARGVGAKDWPNTHTEVEYLGNGKFAASIGVGHRVFFDKTDGNKPKKHKLTDDRPGKDYVLIQSAKACVEVYPYYAKYFDVQHEEVRLYEERWVVQRLFKEPDKWRDVDAYNPQIAVEEYPEPAGDVVKVIVTHDTDYGPLTVEYFQRDGNVLKHNVAFKNTSGSTETFRVVQKWAGIVGAKHNGKDIPTPEDAPFLAFHNADKPKKQFTIAENLWSMIFNPDGSEKTDQCLQRPISIEAHAQGMKADFIYGNWVLAQGESLKIDPDTATLDDPNEDGFLEKVGSDTAGCVACAPTRHNTAEWMYYGGKAVPSPPTSEAWRAYVEWDISSLAGATVTANPKFKYHGKSVADTAGEINPLTEEQPSGGGCTDAELWGYIASGAAYVDPFTLEVGTGKEIDLGASAKTDLQTAIDASQSWFALGIQSPDDECIEGAASQYSQIYTEEKTDTADPKPTLYVEYTPPPPPPPAAPTNVQATDGAYSDKVVITWTKSPGATGYQVYRDGVALGWLGDVATYDDTEAGAPSITPGSSLASDGAYIDKVALSLSGTGTNNGTVHTYKVRARNVGGESPDSATDTGYRAPGSLVYQWQRSAADSDANYSDISGATTASYDDYGAPVEGAGRYYRCCLNASGATQQYSASDRGYRRWVPPTPPAVTEYQKRETARIGTEAQATLESIVSRLVEASVDTGVADDTSIVSRLDDSSKSWPVNAFTDLIVEITGGTGEGQIRKIASNAATSIVPVTNFATAPDSTSTYRIGFFGKMTGDIGSWGGTAVTGRDISLDLKALTDDSIKGLLKSIGDIAAAESLIARIGAIADAVVDAGATGSMSAKLRRLTTDINALIIRMGEVQASPTENTVLDRLKDIETAIGTLTPAASTPVIYNVTMTNLDEEYSQALPANTKKYTIQTRDGTAFRIAFETGKVAAPTEPYFSIGTDGFHHEDLIKPASLTLYFACGEAGKIVEILAWS